MRKVVLLLLVCVCMCAQGAMHIHTNSSDYQAGERIWFRVHEWKIADEALFVELVSPSGDIPQRVKLLPWDGIYSGYLDVPTSCEAGQYLLRAYTRAMMAHISDAGTQIVYVHGRIGDSSVSDSITSQQPLLPDTSRLPRVAMPIHVSREDGGIRLTIDTVHLFPDERVSLSVSVNDRSALASHPQWTIMESLSRRVSAPSFSQPSGEVVRGRIVTPIRGKAFSGAVVNMIVPGTYSYYSDTTDGKGYFAFPDEAVPENMPVLVSAYLPKYKRVFVIQIDEDTFPSYTGILPSRLHLGGEKRLLRTELSNITDSVVLDDIEVTAKRVYKTKRDQHALHLADYSFSLSQIEEYHATCLHDVLRRVPGVNIVNGQCFVRGAHSIYAKNPAAVAINGVIQEGEYDLDLIPMQDVARLDIFKSGTTVIWGARGGDGVISIILKDGSEIPDRTDQHNLKIRRPLGWQQPEAFYVERPHSGRRPAAVFWRPDLRSADVFFPDYYPTVYEVVIEGMTTKGRVVHEKVDF